MELLIMEEGLLALVVSFGGYTSKLIFTEVRRKAVKCFFKQRNTHLKLTSVWLVKFYSGIKYS